MPLILPKGNINSDEEENRWTEEEAQRRADRRSGEATGGGRTATEMAREIGGEHVYDLFLEDEGRRTGAQ
jgi:hypothetical protein